MNEFQNTQGPLTYRQMTQRAAMSWPEREEQLNLEKIRLLKMMVADIQQMKISLSTTVEALTRLAGLIVKAEDKAGDKVPQSPAKAQPK